MKIKSIPFTSPNTLLERADRFLPQAAFIDIDLGGSVSGLQILPQLRQIWPQAVLFVITSDSRDEAIAEALALGVDDFLKKPIQPSELMARFRARLDGKLQSEESQKVRVADLEIHKVQRSIQGPLGKGYLSQTELSLLLYLLQHFGNAVGRAVLKAQVWGDLKVPENALDRKGSNVRKILEETS